MHVHLYLRCQLHHVRANALRNDLHHGKGTVLWLRDMSNVQDVSIERFKALQKLEWLWHVEMRR